jgi:hypothetical protein
VFGFGLGFNSRQPRLGSEIVCAGSGVVHGNETTVLA